MQVLRTYSKFVAGGLVPQRRKDLKGNFQVGTYITGKDPLQEVHVFNDPVVLSYST